MKHRITRRRNKIRQRGGLKFGRIIKTGILECISQQQHSGASITPTLFNECIMMVLLSYATSVDVLSESTRYSLVLRINLRRPDLLQEQINFTHDTVDADEKGYQVAMFCVKITFIADETISIPWSGINGDNYTKNTMTAKEFNDEVETQSRLYESTMYNGNGSRISSFVPHLLASQIVGYTAPVFEKNLSVINGKY
jgi:hypothetical protein